MNDSSQITLRVAITGRVQGVSYRFWTQKRAMALGVTGWVRNRRDGSVEAVFKGARDAVDQLVQDCQDGPTLAKVTGVETVADAYDGPAEFLVEPILD